MEGGGSERAGGRRPERRRVTKALLAAGDSPLFLERVSTFPPPPSVVRRAAGRFGGRTGADARRGCGPGTGQRKMKIHKTNTLTEMSEMNIHFLDSSSDLGKDFTMLYAQNITFTLIHYI